MDTEYIPLNNIEIGDRVSIAKVKAGDNTAGVFWTWVLLKAPIYSACSKAGAANPPAYLIRNTVIALRKEDSGYGSRYRN